MSALYGFMLYKCGQNVQLYFYVTFIKNMFPGEKFKVFFYEIVMTANLFMYLRMHLFNIRIGLLFILENNVPTKA